MKFTIVAGIYNHLNYLPNMIKAFENQTFKDFEVIFCDDGSNDGTKEYFETADFKFKWQYKRQRQKGMRLAKNLNQGIKVAKGEYCVFIMGDSFPELNYLEVLNEYANEDFILCGIRNYIDNGRAVDVDWRLKKSKIPQDVRVLIERPYNLMTGNGLTVPTSALRQYGGWNEKIKGYGGDDNELIARLYFKGYLCWSLPHAILYHHWHKETVNPDTNLKYINKLILKYAGQKKTIKEILLRNTRLWLSTSWFGGDTKVKEDI